jgi:hypothetical protein
MAWITNCRKCGRSKLIDKSVGPPGSAICYDCSGRNRESSKSAIDAEETKKCIQELDDIIARAQKEKARLEQSLGSETETFQETRQRLADTLQTVRPDRYSSKHRVHPLMRVR